MEDKRVYERFDLEVPARIGIAGSDQASELSLRTSNICAGGAFFISTEPLPEGTRVKMDFVLSIEKLKEMLNSHCRIKVEGEVVRNETAGIAVRFDEDYEIIPVKEALH
jgi:hypothetical protein